MSRRIIALICVGIFASLCWTATIFLCAFLTGFRTFELVEKLTEKTVLVQGTDPASDPDIRILDANNPYFKMISVDPNRVDVQWTNVTTNIKYPQCRIKLHNTTLVRVTGKLNGAEYPIVIDSGCNQGLIVNDVVVIKNKLPIFPLSTEMPIAGFCQVEKLEIGDIVVTNPVCCYEIRIPYTYPYERRKQLINLCQTKDL